MVDGLPWTQEAVGSSPTTLTKNNMALVLMVARWIPNPKVRVRIFQAMPKLEVQFAASGEIGRRKRLKIS